MFDNWRQQINYEWKVNNEKVEIVESFIYLRTKLIWELNL